MAQSFWEQHNQGQQGLSKTTQRMVRALPRVFTEEQSEARHRSIVTLGEIKEAVRVVQRKKSPGVDQLVAGRHTRTSGCLNWMVWRGGSRRCCAQASPQCSGGARCGPCIRKGITSGRGTKGQYAVPSRRPSWCGWWSLGGCSRGCMQQGSYGTTRWGPWLAGPQHVPRS